MTIRSLYEPNTEDDDRLDQTIEDSFPASDPPSHTPTTSLGSSHAAAAEHPLEINADSMAGRVLHAPRAVLIGAAVGGLALLIVVARAWRAHQRSQAPQWRRGVAEAAKLAATHQPHPITAIKEHAHRGGHAKHRRFGRKVAA